MGRRRVCNELIGELLVDKDGDSVNNFLAVITNVQQELQDTYHDFRIFADTETLGVFKIYGIRYLTDEETAQARELEAKKVEMKKMLKAAKGRQ